MLTANEPATETLAKQVQRSVPGKYADLIAKCFSQSRSSRRREAKVAGVTLMLGIAGIACRFCPIFDLRGGHIAAYQALFSDSRLRGTCPLYEHNAKGQTCATGTRIDKEGLCAGPKEAASEGRTPIVTLSEKGRLRCPYAEASGGAAGSVLGPLDGLCYARCSELIPETRGEASE